MHTMEQSAGVVKPKKIEIKALNEFEKAYHFVKNKQIFKICSWADQPDNTLVVLCLEKLLAQRDKNRDTLLHQAARKNNRKAAKRLIRLGLAIDEKNADKETARDLAQKLGKPAVHQVLRAHEDLLSTNLYLEQVTKSLKAQACVNVRECDGYTLLLRCTWGRTEDENNVKVVKKLLDAKAGVNVKTPGGYTALHHAAYMGNIETTKLLIDARASVNEQSSTLLNTPLHDVLLGYGCKRKEDIVKLLLDAHADTRIKDHEGKTAFEVAQTCKLNAIIVLLEQAEQKQKQS